MSFFISSLAASFGGKLETYRYHFKVHKRSFAAHIARKILSTTSKKRSTTNTAYP